MSAVFWGNLGVLGVTVGIFLGTVFLTRASRTRASVAPPPRSDSTSQQT